MPETYDRAALRRELERDEDRRQRAYRDSEGIWTVGVGWNLEANDLPDDVIDRLLDISIDQAVRAVERYLPRWRELDAPRQRVLLNMAFNLGADGLAEFKRLKGALIAYLETRNPSWLRHAANEMMASTWAGQVGPRADRLERVMRGE